MALCLAPARTVHAADGEPWLVSRSSGDVWLSSDSAEPVSLQQDQTLKPGETIRTGRNGRVLLVRGKETMLISANSVVGLPKEKTEGLATTIVQQAGSILLDVEKQNVKHFEVETPFLAAVVKGTQFSVTVGKNSTSVGVTRGQVEVSDFKTGQIAQVMPGQAATIFAHGKAGLVLSGSGTFNPIQQGKPRMPSIQRIPVPRGGLSAPQHAYNGGGKQGSAAALVKPANAAGGGAHLATAPKSGTFRIGAPIGEVKLNFHKVTNGLSHGPAMPGAHGNRTVPSQDSASIWSAGQNGSAGAGSNANSGSAGNSANIAAPPASVVGPAVISSASGSNDGGPGNNGNGKGGGAANAAGNGPGANNGGGNGNGANGNGNNGQGHGNGNGNGKH